MIIKKRNFKDYPNPIGHMVSWGFGSGTILGTLFSFWIFNQAPNATTDILSRLLLLLPSLLAGLMFGGISGVVLGLFSGVTLSRAMKNVLAPFTWEDMQAYRAKIYIYVGLVTTILASVPIFFLMYLIFWIATSSVEIAAIPYQFYAGLLIPLIAGIASVYAAHRYLFRLRLWSEAISQKEKAKNFEHLEDKAKNEEIDFENEAQSQSRQK